VNSSPPEQVQSARPHSGESGQSSLRKTTVSRRVWWLKRGTIALLSLCVLGAIILSWAWRATPHTDHLLTWVHAQTAARHEIYTPYNAIAPVMSYALVSIEDERFYQHHGIDTIGLIRAAWADLRAGRIVEGGSTLTAQLAKNAYLNGYDHNIPLKAEDLLLAFKIERHYSKSQILEMYLNLVYFGQGAYGIHAAAQRYFGVTPAHLDVAQAALLAGLVQAPGYYDPLCHPSLARERQHAVLARMYADGYISHAMERKAASEEFTFWRSHPAQTNNVYCAA